MEITFNYGDIIECTNRHCTGGGPVGVILVECGCIARVIKTEGEGIGFLGETESGTEFSDYSRNWKWIE